MPLPSHPLITALQLGQTLTAARKARNLSQSALAARLGLSQSRISHLELHAQELSVQQLLAWCAALGLELAIGLASDGKAANAQTDW